MAPTFVTFCVEVITVSDRKGDTRGGSGAPAESSRVRSKVFEHYGAAQGSYAPHIATLGYVVATAAG